jgi:hypothetical protein
LLKEEWQGDLEIICPVGDVSLGYFRSAARELLIYSPFPAK